MHRILLIGLLALTTTFPVNYFLWTSNGSTCGGSLLLLAAAKELEPKVGEWTRIGENDTIPAGMHVRIDMTTGEKWVKQLDPEDDEQNKKPASSSSRNSNKQVALQVSGESDETTSNKVRAAPTEPAYDYDRMYQTLAQLPPEEHERMGGLPEPPKPTTTIDPQRMAEMRKVFEARMKEIWEARQAELRRIQQEEVADMPEILRTNIRYMQEYWNGQRSATQTTADLQELEYLLSDVDMARDFYTLQGWPWLLAILAQPPHNETTSTIVSSKEIDALQAAAAWVIGTAVQNTGEFRPWVVESVALPSGTSMSALDALMRLWTSGIVNSETTAPALAQKVLYALSACLRGNPLAQLAAHQNGLPHRLQQDLRDTPADTAHGRKQILRILQLGHDLLMEWDQAVAMAVGSENNHDPDTVAVVEQFQTAWTTVEWCHTVLDKVRIVTRADKRLPLIDAWVSHCQEAWDLNAVREMLTIVDNEDEDLMDKETKVLHQNLLQKTSPQGAEE